MSLQHKPNIRHANTCPPLPPNSTLFDKLIYRLGIGLGSGLPKKAPGTWGTVAGLILILPCLTLPMFHYLSICFIGSILGIFICDKTSRLMNVHDDPHIVFDEWVGMWISLIPLNYFLIDQPDSFTMAQLTCYTLLGFILFRIFDILKPYPIRQLDRTCTGGFGIMIDDIIAGLFAAILLFISIYLNQ